ncbi:hypothetical protein SLEP1_g57678 [Rubroshorea leprosula]|uniref:Uncharacterized protein n=1 Tax=Rubroshorea leprosula TaxID=152421 RepID=A0AAV5MN81_9ROSI|nr:hypothetical protein SLEP1_g57678 [Rubroshorea leprosula]
MKLKKLKCCLALAKQPSTFLPIMKEESLQRMCKETITADKEITSGNHIKTIKD